MKNRITIIALLSWFACSLSFSQGFDSIFSKAKFYYENEEYAMAIPWFTKYIAYNPVYYKTYLLRGNSYLETGENSRAINDYLYAIKLKNDHELLYNLGGAYEKVGKIDSALYFFKRYANSEPTRTEGFVRLSIIYLYNLPLNADSAIRYASRAVELKPKDLVCINLLAMSYYAGNKFEDALATAKLGLETDSSSTLLNRTAGISSFFLKDYASSVFYFDRAFRYKADDYTLLDFKIQSMLLQNTRPEILVFEAGQRPAFKEISRTSIKKIVKKSSKAYNPYYYEKLLSGFNTSPQKMSLDEYLMFYVGHSRNNVTEIGKINTTPTDKNPAIEVQNLETILKRNPTDFPKYLELARIYAKAGNQEEYFRNMFKYLGFVEGIKASGNGLEPSSAFLTTEISHEYSFAQSLGYNIKSRKQLKNKGISYDVLQVNNAAGDENSLYFKNLR